MTTNKKYVPVSIQRRVSGILLVIFFVILIAIFMAPFISIILTSFKESSKIIGTGFNLNFDPANIKYDNYLAT